MIQQGLQKLLDKQDLTRAEMAEVFGEIMSATATPVQVAAFLTALRLKGETVEEVTGAAEVVRARLEPLTVRAPIFVDTCGTGGDGQNTFNISTTTAFVVAGAGVPVAKHGNKAVSSRSGSADVLAALGVNVAAPLEVVERCIAELGIGFLFAPRHHPSFKAVAEVRRELGFRTLFNLLGPLANPARARRQLIGVYEARWVPILGRVLAALGAEHAFVVHGDGLDEVSVSGVTRVCEVRAGNVRDLELTPEELGLSRWPLSALASGSSAESSRILRGVLDGKPGAPRDAVLANAALALVAGDAAPDFRGAAALAARAIDEGRAAEKLSGLLRLAPSPPAA